MTEYATDAYAWAMETAAAIRTRQFDRVDWDAVGEEIEAVGRSERRAVKHRVDRIIKILIKLDLARGVLLDGNQAGWTATVIEQRRRLARLFVYNPSLRAEKLSDANVAESYRSQALVFRTPYGIELPQECPYRASDLLPEVEG